MNPSWQGGLDQWTLGHLPVHERLMEGEQTSGVPKAPDRHGFWATLQYKQIAKGLAGECPDARGARATG